MTDNRTEEQGSLRTDGGKEILLYLRTEFLSGIVMVCATAIATAFFIKWWALAWLAVVLTLMVTTRARAMKMGSSGITTRQIVLGTILTVSPAVAAWVVGGAQASIVGSFALCLSCLGGATVFFGSWTNLIARLAPAFVLIIVAGVIGLANSAQTIILLVCAIQLFVATLSARACIVRSRTEFLRVESDARRAREESMAKSQFLAMISHELRTPLNAVIGYAEMLEEELADESQTAKAADAARIRRSGQNLLSLINDILDFSKIQAGGVKPHIDEVDVLALLKEVVGTVDHLTAAHGTEVSVEVAPDAYVVSTDLQKLRQCVLNLVSNAAKFTEGGKIAIRAAIDGAAGAKCLRIDIDDTGCGIDEVDALHLFHPFAQVDSSLTRKTGGTGLGLVITKQLSELLGGGVGLVSTKGLGSTFTIRVRDYAAH